MNSTWPWYVILFIYYLILSANILVRIFPSIGLKNTGLDIIFVCFILTVFVWFSTKTRLLLLSAAFYVLIRFCWLMVLLNTVSLLSRGSTYQLLRKLKSPTITVDLSVLLVWEVFAS